MKYRFCPYCGSPLETLQEDSRKRLYCVSCDKVHYRNPTVGVAVILAEHSQLLLVRRIGSYDGMWCIPCGHLEWGEDVRDAAAREFAEETGLEVAVGQSLPCIPIFMIWSGKPWVSGSGESGSVDRCNQDPMPARRVISISTLYPKQWPFPQIDWCVQNWQNASRVAHCRNG